MQMDWKNPNPPGRWATEAYTIVSIRIIVSAPNEKEAAVRKERKMMFGFFPGAS